MPCNVLNEICGSESFRKCQHVAFFRGILWRLTIRPTVQDRIKSLHIEDVCHFGVPSQTPYLFRNVMSRARQPREPVSSLGTGFLLVEHGIWQPSFHGAPDQPAVAAFVQILILWNPNTKFEQAPIARRRPN